MGKLTSARVQPREVLANIGSISWFGLALLGLASSFYYVVDMKLWLSQMEREETEIVRFTEQRIGSHFEPAIADLIVLSESSSILNYLAHPGVSERTAIELDFLRWSRRKSGYFEICL